MWTQIFKQTHETICMAQVTHSHHATFRKTIVNICSIVYLVLVAAHFNDHRHKVTISTFLLHWLADEFLEVQ